MAKMSRTKLQQIIDRDAPGNELVKKQVSDVAAPRRATPDAISPELDEVRRQYGVTADPESDSVRVRAARGAAKTATTKSAGKKADDDRIMIIKPKNAPGAKTDSWIGSAPKAVVISGGKIIGRQG